jgi:hypothetical protein
VPEISSQPNTQYQPSTPRKALMPPPIVMLHLPVGVGKGQVLDQPDQPVGAVQGQVDPGRGAGVAIPPDQEPEKEEGAGLLEVDDPGELPRPGPPPKSCESQSVKRRIASAQAGAGLAEPAAAGTGLAGFIGRSSVRTG